jgi:DNA repair protein RadA/Sms
VLGGGIVPGSLILIGGEPGIGKSTLLLQLGRTTEREENFIYQRVKKVSSRFACALERIGKMQSECYILTETTTQNIFQQIEVLQPEMVIVDSIQTLYSNIYESAPGTGFSDQRLYR